MARTQTREERRVVAVLSLAMLVSSAGTTLLLVATSVGYLELTDSALTSSLVYVAQYLPPVLFAPLVARVCDRVPSRALLVTVELASLAVSVAVGIAFGGPYWVVFVLLLVRGLLDTTMKSARAVAAKNHLSAAALARGNTMLNAGYYVGAGLGALLGIGLLGSLSVLQISVVNGATFALAAGVYATLGRRPARPASGGSSAPPVRGPWRTTLRAVRADPLLARSFCFLVASVTLLQGVNQVLRVWLPIKWLGLPAQGGALTELVGLVGVLAGVALVGVAMTDRPRRADPRVSVSFAAAGICALAIVATHAPVPAFAAYLLFTVLFEVVYTKSMNDTLLLASVEDTPAVVATFYSVAFAGMSLVVVLAGLAIDRFGLPAVLAVLTAANLALVTSTGLLSRRAHDDGVPSPALDRESSDSGV